MNKLKTLRLLTGKTAHNIALQIGVSTRTLRRWEVGTSIPDLFQAQKWASALGISLDDLAVFAVQYRTDNTHNGHGTTALNTGTRDNSH